MTNHYNILGLQFGASEMEIRRAYRNLAKQFHPDVNNAPDAEEKFMKINLAYEFLMDPAQRNNYSRLQDERADRAEQERRENIYKLWVEHQERQMRYRRAVEYSYRQQGKTPPHNRFISGANGFFNLVSILLFIAIAVIPIWKYIEQLSKPEHQQRSFLYFFIPATLGVVFLIFGYYYWFINKIDKK
ncbi:MAG: J domain-containing protein [Flavobacteriales bacterium]